MSMNDFKEKSWTTDIVEDWCDMCEHHGLFSWQYFCLWSVDAYLIGCTSCCS